MRGAARCSQCSEVAIVEFSHPQKGRTRFCAEHARPLFKEGLRSLPHHDWEKGPDRVREGMRWTCRKCGESVGPKETSQRAVRERLELERCEP
jgi:hypothetical protein